MEIFQSSSAGCACFGAVPLWNMICHSFDFYPKGRIGFYRSLFADNAFNSERIVFPTCGSRISHIWLPAATSKKTKKITL
jgi:hypothetical protein